MLTNAHDAPTSELVRFRTTETAAEHVRNALQILVSRADSEFVPAELEAIDRRLQSALGQLDPHSGAYLLIDAAAQLVGAAVQIPIARRLLRNAVQSIDIAAAAALVAAHPRFMLCAKCAEHKTKSAMAEVRRGFFVCTWCGSMHDEFAAVRP